MKKFAAVMVLCVVGIMSGCGAKSIQSLKERPKIHLSATVPGHYNEVFAKSRYRVFDCLEPTRFETTYFENKEKKIIETPIGGTDGYAFYASWQEISEGVTQVDIYSNFRCCGWDEFAEVLYRGATDTPGCP